MKKKKKKKVQKVERLDKEEENQRWGKKEKMEESLNKIKVREEKKQVLR